MEELYSHEDFLKELNADSSLSRKLEILHEALRTSHPFVDRMAVALFDSKSQTLKTFLASSGSDHPLEHYETQISKAPLLTEILKLNRPRVVNDLALFENGIHEHTRKIEEQGYGSSYTLPLYFNDQFIGFVFFNSYQKNCFLPEVLRQLDVIGHLAGSAVVNELHLLQTMLAALRTAKEMVHQKDPETGNHLERMARFSKLIARQLVQSGKRNFDDDFIEHIFLFSPLHDVGKIGIPDKVLLKPGKLDKEEWETMRTHARKGREIVDSIIKEFGFQSFEHVDVLRHIAQSHHETLNGSGYPEGLRGEDVPIEARIIAVADIFDALTSERSYKKAWPNEDAFACLQFLARDQLDEDCVDALLRNRKAVEEIQQTFKDEELAASVGSKQG